MKEFAPSGRAWGFGVIALVTYTAVIIALTTLKSFFQIGYLWVPERQRVREVHLQPFDDLAAGSWFAPLFEYAGNFALFAPFGVLTYALLFRPEARWRAVLRATLAGAALSLAIEIAQYAFSVGRTDVDDLLMNTLGTLAGATVAAAIGPRAFKAWTWLGLIVSAVFAVLVILGPRLGDPDKVVDVYGASREPYSQTWSSAAGALPGPYQSGHHGA